MMSEFISFDSTETRVSGKGRVMEMSLCDGNHYQEC